MLFTSASVVPFSHLISLVTISGRGEARTLISRILYTGAPGSAVIERFVAGRNALKPI